MIVIKYTLIWDVFPFSLFSVDNDLPDYHRLIIISFLCCEGCSHVQGYKCVPSIDIFSVLGSVLLIDQTIFSVRISLLLCAELFSSTYLSKLTPETTQPKWVPSKLMVTVSGLSNDVWLGSGQDSVRSTPGPSLSCPSNTSLLSWLSLSLFGNSKKIYILKKPAVVLKF